MIEDSGDRPAEPPPRKDTDPRAAALRANLARRKAQQRDRAEAATRGETDPEDPG